MNSISDILMLLVFVGLLAVVIPLSAIFLTTVVIRAAMIIVIPVLLGRSLIALLRKSS